MVTKKILTFLLFGIILLMPLGFALELNPFADIKQFEITPTEDMSAFLKSDFNEDYGVIRLSKSFFWFESDKIAEYSLTSNTKNCSYNCEAKGKVVLYSDGILFDSVQFKTLRGKETSIISSEYQILDGIKEVVKEIPVTFKTVCKDTPTGNGNEVAKLCSDEVASYGTEIEKVENWVKYNGQTLKAGEYQWRIIGEKVGTKSVDFIPIRYDKEFSEWAVWGAGTPTVNVLTADSGWNTAPQTDHLGFRFVVKEGITAVNVTKSASSDAPYLRLLDDAGTLIDSTSFIGDNAYISYAFVTGNYYRLEVYATPSSYNSQYKAYNYPVVATTINFTGGSKDGVDNTDWTRDIINVITEGTGGGSSLTINSPVDYYNSSSQLIDTFNCSATIVGATFTNWTLWTNQTGNWAETNTSTENGGLLSSNFATDGSYLWGCKVYDSDDDFAWSDTNRTLTIDTIKPTFVLNSLNNLSTITDVRNVSLNVTTTDTNLADCSYTTSESSTRIIYTCNTQTNISFSTGGDKNITVYANDTFSNENSTTYPVRIYDFNVSQTGSSTAGEGTSQSFTLLVTSTSFDIGDASANLWYNGENKGFTTKTAVGSNGYYFINTFSVPTGAGNTTGKEVEWYWNYNATHLTTRNTTTETQSVYNVSISDCAVVGGEVILNLSLKDEGENTFLNVSDEITNIELDLILGADSGQDWQYSNQWANENNVTVCVPSGLLTNSNYSIDFTIGFDAGSHVNEFYYLDNGTLSSDNTFNSFSNKTINLMDLLTADSTSFLFNYFDEDGLVVDDIIVHVFRKYIGEGLFREVERSKQNDDGDTVVHLVEEDVIYYFMITKQGQILFTSSTYTALCQSTPCEIQLEESGGFQEFDTDWDLIDNGGYTLTSSSNTREVNLTYSLTSSSTMNLTVYKLDGNGDYQVVGSDQDTGTNGEILVSVPTVSGNTTFFATVYQDGTFKKSQWIDFEEDAGLYFGNTLSLFLGALIILALGLMAVSEGSATILFLTLGMFVAMSLGLVDYRTSTGLNILIYFILAGGIIVWKLTRRNR